MDQILGREPVHKIESKDRIRQPPIISWTSLVILGIADNALLGVALNVPKNLRYFCSRGNCTVGYPWSSQGRVTQWQKSICLKFMGFKRVATLAGSATRRIRHAQLAARCV